MGYFPPPHPDELLYSVLARYGALLPQPIGRAVSGDAFGRSTVTAIVDFPTHLGRLIQNMPLGVHLTADVLIDRHTLWPLHRPFWSAQRASAVRLAMSGDGHPGWRVGLAAAMPQPAGALQYCPACAATDRVAGGEAYWRRIHQVPGVEVCHIHRCVLLSSTIQPSTSSNRHVFVSAQSVIPTDGPVVPGGVTDVQVFLAATATWLLEHASSLPYVPDAEQLRRFYVRRLAQLGLATPSGQVRAGELLAAFAARYPAEWLTRLGCALDHSSGSWLLRLLRRPRSTQHPLRHLLLWHFLGLMPQGVFEQKGDDGFHGSGPWPCLNPVCTRYLEAVVEVMVLSFSSNARRPVGRFACPVCGFTYLRTGPDETAEDRRRFDRVPMYGLVWEQALRRDWLNEKVSLRSLASHLGVTTRTLYRQAVRLGLPPLRPGAHAGPPPEPERKGVVRVDSLAKHAEAWTRARNEHPTASRTQLRCLVPAAYSALHRARRSWLEVNSPEVATRKGSGRRIDWEARDVEIADALRHAAVRLRRRVTLPVRLTRASLAREAGHLVVVQRHLERLPGTSAVLDELVEGRETFAVRRIHLAALRLREVGVVPPSWKVEREAGLRPPVSQAPGVRAAVLSAIRFLQAAADAASALREA